MDLLRILIVETRAPPVDIGSDIEEFGRFIPGARVVRKRYVGIGSSLQVRTPDAHRRTCVQYGRMEIRAGRLPIPTECVLTVQWTTRVTERTIQMHFIYRYTRGVGKSKIVGKSTMKQPFV